jgi:hypothetical protein
VETTLCGISNAAGSMTFLLPRRHTRTKNQINGEMKE